MALDESLLLLFLEFTRDDVRLVILQSQTMQKCRAPARTIRPTESALSENARNFCRLFNKSAYI